VLSSCINIGWVYSTPDLYYYHLIKFSWLVKSKLSILRTIGMGFVWLRMMKKIQILIINFGFFNQCHSGNLETFLHSDVPTCSQKADSISWDTRIWKLYFSWGSALFEFSLGRICGIIVWDPLLLSVKQGWDSDEDCLNLSCIQKVTQNTSTKW